VPELMDFHALDEAARSAFKPHFADVERRAHRRRRRHQTAALSAAVAALAGTGGVAVLAGGGGSQSVGSTLPSPAVTPGFIPQAHASVAAGPKPSHHATTGAMVAGDLEHLYLRYDDCHGSDCALRIASTSDGGTHWTTSALPVGHNALVTLITLGPRTLLAWTQENDLQGTHSWHASVDGGHTWRTVELRPVDTIPAGWPVLSDGLASSQPGVGDVAPIAADPATGDVVQLRQGRPLKLGYPIAGVPPAAGLWVVGYLGTTPSPEPTPNQPVDVGTGTTVDVSHDGGKTWHRYSVPDQLSSNPDVVGPAVASFDGQTAYVIGEINGQLAVYRTDDGGLTWLRTAAAAHTGDVRLHASVRPDGTLLIQAGDQAGDHPTMYESTDRGTTVHPVRWRPGASAVIVPGGYAQTNWPNTSGAWLSPDGVEWSYVSPPALP
jgi:hypothetical protein